MLNAISFYCFNTDITKKEIDELRKINNTYMKEKSPIAKETNSRKKHLEIKTKIYLSTTDKNLMKILTIGGELNPKFCFPIRRTCGKIFIQCLWKQHRNIWQFI